MRIEIGRNPHRKKWNLYLSVAVRGYEHVFSIHLLEWEKPVFGNSWYDGPHFIAEAGPISFYRGFDHENHT